MKQQWRERTGGDLELGLAVMEGRSIDVAEARAKLGEGGGLDTLHGGRQVPPRETNFRRADCSPAVG